MNDGVQISGGSVTVAAMAVGRNARISDVTAHVTSGAPASVAAPADQANPAGQGDSADQTEAAGAEKDLQFLLIELGEQIEAQSTRLPDPEEALRLVDELRGVLEQPQAGPEHARSLLARLVESLRPAGELAALTMTVGEAVRSVLGLK